MLNELAAYIAVLNDSASRTSRAEDRAAYTRHLAAAARMFVAIDAGDHAELMRIVAGEEHGYGWSFLDGAVGEAAEASFSAFATSVRSRAPAT